MLYKKNAAPRLERTLFEKPTSEYRATPFWSWNCKLEKDEGHQITPITLQLSLQ